MAIPTVASHFLSKIACQSIAARERTKNTEQGHLSDLRPPTRSTSLCKDPAVLRLPNIGKSGDTCVSGNYTKGLRHPYGLD